MGQMEPQPHRVGYERRDVRVGAIVWAAVGLAVVSALTFAAMAGLLARFAKREARLSPPASPLAGTYAPKAPPAPRLQAEPIRDLEALRAHEDTLLGSYGWVDHEAGTVRIPIERAIEILAARAAAPEAPQPRSGP